MSRRQTLALVSDLLRLRANSEALPVWDRHDLGAQDWAGVVALASAHFVLPALAPALASAPPGNRPPDEAAGFLAEITQANAMRNRTLRSALVAVGGQLESIGVRPVVLKGAAFLADDQVGAADAAVADWRFMQDLDLLVPVDRLSDCVAALTELGYRAASRDYDPATEAHYPPLQSPCGAFSIELHTRLFGHGDFGLTAAAVTREARPADVGGVELLLPSPRHRLGHILVHAQIHNRFHAAERLVLKDLLDLSMLSVRHARVLQAEVVDQMFEADRQVLQATRALFDTWSAWAAASAARVSDPGPWGRRAQARLGWSGWQLRAHMPADLARLELHRLRTEPGHVVRRLETLARPSRLAATAAAWSAKQRQRLWG